ncbi:MAG: YggS family pyridoxal phosphate-dependent enzyme [Pseudomonadales bacterium]
MGDIANNLVAVQSRVTAALANTPNRSNNVQILAVSKQQSAAAIRTLAALGLRDFGENYLQEALPKQQQLQDLDLVWHFIGHIQTNKSRLVAQHFDWVHSVDRLKVAHRLNDQRPAELAALNICLQVNISEEESKAGVAPAKAEELALAITELPHVKLRGLMAIPRTASDYDQQLQAFTQLKALFDSLNASGLQLDTLSMGMSHDLEAALAAGATMLRIGQALFGPRAA